MKIPLYTQSCEENEEGTFITKGDANKNADPDSCGKVADHRAGGLLPALSGLYHIFSESPDPIYCRMYYGRSVSDL